jgi:transcriptional regulator with XRE-family HTH domain
MSKTSLKSKPPAAPIDKAVGERILSRRKEMGLSQTQLGEFMGISYQQIQKYETGLNRPNTRNLQKLAEGLEVPLTYFFIKGPSNQDHTASVNVPDGMSKVEANEILSLMNSLPSPKMKKQVLNLLREIVG